MPSFSGPRRFWAIVITVVAALVVTGAVLAPRLLRDEREEPLVARISVDRSLVRLGELVLCSADESSGDIEGYHWNLGEGNTSAKDNVKICYTRCGWYNVTLTVRDGRGGSSTATARVGVQQHDDTYVNEFGEIKHWFDDGRLGTSIMGTIGPSIGRPTVRAHFQVENAVGDISLEIGQRVGDSYRTLSSQNMTLVREDIDREFEVAPEFIAKGSENAPSLISAELWISNGQVSEGTITLEIVFPFEGLVPP